MSSLIIVGEGGSIFELGTNSCKINEDVLTESV